MTTHSLIKYVVILLIYFLSSALSCASNTLTLTLEKINLSEAIQTIAQALEMNVIVSPAIKGEVSIHWRQVEPYEAFDMLLAAEGLGKINKGKIFFIAPLPELLKYQQDKIKWQALKNEASSLNIAHWQMKYARASDIANLLRDNSAAFLSKRGHVEADVRTNTLLIQETTIKLHELSQIIKFLDVPIKQVLIKTKLVSVDSGYEKDLGINFSLQQINRVLPQAGQYSLAVAHLPDGSLLDIKLSALEAQGHAELVSRPTLLTANQQTAFIESGEEVPYQEVSESGGTAVAFKKAVLRLKATPQLLPGQRILLQLQINQDRPSSKMILGMPTISTRQMVTNVLVHHGETVVLGGIYEQNEESASHDIPFISHIPFIGFLFKQLEQRHTKRELLVFVTPQIVLQ